MIHKRFNNKNSLYEQNNMNSPKNKNRKNER